MITTNVFQRIFRLKHGKSHGTCFTIDYEHRRYLVTAAHVCYNIKNKDNINIFYHEKWHPLNVKVVGVGDSSDLANDITVLAPENLIRQQFDLPASIGGIVLGQEVYFLGFPYGLHSKIALNDGYPFPFIKRGLFSGNTGKMDTILLDGHNNPGFSGGPVVFRPGQQMNIGYQVAGIVSAFRTEQTEITLDGKPTGLAAPTNTGIVVCPSIKRAIEMIEENPIGCPLM